ncbi:Disease resistance protein (CC-NBS-LRR class) family [Rhynchospora pubera]|uniref:Disease resistance protein (CC-NBS-LRR class) family n=1 Tax=Rhynchospora pubera TaxID=906938 RepID=A0AAV8CF65_9POAL|nr:Disease resistance protein (CC-NBS-LRR class) family [Rhynchospora pubera]
MILPIVGVGGLGKTTLAQLVYNDERFRQHFDRFGWIWVFNDFDVKRFTKAILESVTEYSSNNTELSLLQGELKKELASKRVFLVLDDVWDDQHSHWQSLMVPFFSPKRVSILVTTRNQSVALTTQTISHVKLGALPDEQCWKIFQHYALSGFPNIIKHQDLLELGRRIINKSSGLPLAVKSIATLLRYENEERWEVILQSEIWGEDPKNEAFSALRISYICLPEHLKSCLLFCSMFPKGYFYEENELINLWIAQNYVVSRGKMSMEEIGSEFIRELRQRSFLDLAYSVSSSNNQTYKIHDVVHDLLCLISKGAHRELHVDSPVHTTDDICYHLLVEGRSNLIDMHFMPKQLTMLRTLILRYRQMQALNDKNGHLVLPNIKRLRALEIFVRSEYYSLIPIGQMKHLRHLVLYNYNGDLEPICQLFHLRSILLSNCLLKELPKGFGNLVNLKSLSLSRCGIKSLPESFSLHSKLEKLGIWFCHKLEILPKNLGKLVNLRELRIDECPLQALPESMCELSNLKSLTLDCSDNHLKVPEAIGNLLNLQELSINAQIDYLPPSFNKLYNNCRSTRLHHVVVGESGGVGWLRNFENFKGTLCFENLSNLVDLDEVWQNILVAMHNLEGLVLGWDSHVYVIKEPSMRDKNVLFVSITRSSDRLPSEQMSLSILESLKPHRNLKQLALSSLCASLQTINLHFCYNLCSLSFGNLSALRNFRLWGPKGLSSLPEDSFPPQLEKLDIYNGYNLISMPVLLRLVSLVELRISSCYKLRPFVMESDHDTKSWLPPTFCSVEIQDFPLLKDWCLQQGIHYEESWSY